MSTLLRRLNLWQVSLPDEGTDADLVASAQQDRHAFARLYQRYFAVIYRYCYVRLGSAERAEDACHQVFIRAMEAVDRYEESGRFRAWLFTIARNVVASEQSGRLRDGDDSEVEEVVDPARGPEATALATIEQQTLHAALARLPPDQQRAMTLRLAGLTGKEIAHEMGRSHEAVKMLQQRALARLRVELGGHKPGDPRHVA